MKTPTKITQGVSDLFFNHSHDNFNALFKDPKKGPPLEDQRAAILEDAKEFVGQLERAYVGCTEDAEALADDFMARV